MSRPYYCIFSNSQERVILVYGFIPNHLFYFTTSRMLQIALALTSRNHYHFSLLDFHWKLQQDYFLPCLFMLEFFIFHEISLRCSIWEARRKIYRRTQIYFCLLDIRNCRCLLHGIVACYVLGNDDIVLIDLWRDFFLLKC